MGKLIVKTEFLEKTLPVVLVQLGGYIDQSNSDKLQKVFDDLFTSEHFFLLFDLTHLIYMSSAGWGIFVGEVKRFRESGGDIKLANMNSEIYELFQMLEFYHILEDYYSIDEALEAFGVEVKKDSNEEDQTTETNEDEEMGGEASIDDSGFLDKTREILDDVNVSSPETKTEVSTESSRLEYQLSETEGLYKEPFGQDLEIDISILPLQEKARKIIAKYPLISLGQIKKMLKHSEFGHEKVSVLKLYFLLKDMNLETKAKRYRFYRSC
jgi:anti-sigma B factor antagonist